MYGRGLRTGIVGIIIEAVLVVILGGLEVGSIAFGAAVGAATGATCARRTATGAALTGAAMLGFVVLGTEGVLPFGNFTLLPLGGMGGVSPPFLFRCADCFAIFFLVEK